MTSAAMVKEKSVAARESASTILFTLYFGLAWALGALLDSSPSGCKGHYHLNGNIDCLQSPFFSYRATGSHLGFICTEEADVGVFYHHPAPKYIWLSPPGKTRHIWNQDGRPLRKVFDLHDITEKTEGCVQSIGSTMWVTNIVITCYQKP